MVFEEYDLKDVAQTIVGSFGGAIAYAYSTDLTVISDPLSLLNVTLIISFSIFTSVLIAYFIGVRNLGNKKIRMLGFIPLRTAVHYASALIFSAFILYLLGINHLATPFDIIVRRVIVLALPATVLGSAVDLIESQKQ
jgi:uncharacterized membrane protein